MSDESQRPPATGGRTDLVGADPEDPRVAEAIARYERGQEGEELQAVTANPAPLEKYGVKLRTPSLMQSAMLARIANKGTLAAEFQPFIWLFTLGAPLEAVYGALYRMDREGGGVHTLMAAAQEWFEASGIPSDVTQDIVDAVAQTFLLAEKLMPKGGNADYDGKLKKNERTGPSSPATSLPPNMDGPSATSGGESPSQES